MVISHFAELILISFVIWYLVANGQQNVFKKHLVCINQDIKDCFNIS